MGVNLLERHLKRVLIQRIHSHLYHTSSFNSFFASFLSLATPYTYTIIRYWGVVGERESLAAQGFQRF